MYNVKRLEGFTFGLKCSADRSQVDDRVKYQPDIIEIQLFHNDLYVEEKFVALKETIKYIQDKGIKVVLHQPMKTPKNVFVHIFKNEFGQSDQYYSDLEILYGLMLEFDVNCVIHGNYSDGELIKLNSDFSLTKIPNTDDDMKLLEEKLIYIRDKYENKFLIENSVLGVYHFGVDEKISDLTRKLGISTCLDISHLSASCQGDNDMVEKEIKKLGDLIKYFHIVDSKGYRFTHDALKLGEGVVDWKRIKPLLKDVDGIYEIGLTDFNDCTDMVESYKYLIEQ